MWDIFLSPMHMKIEERAIETLTILTLIGIVNLPIIKWSVDWWNTLHQPASISKFSSPSIDDDMLIPLFLMFFSFLLFFTSLLILRIKSEIVVRKIEIIELNSN